MDINEAGLTKLNVYAIVVGAFNDRMDSEAEMEIAKLFHAANTSTKEIVRICKLIIK